MINFPDDQSAAAWARSHKMPIESLMRDIARLVEILNLDAQGFFHERSVLSGSMALRSFGSTRFTTYDTDLSTSADKTREELAQMLAYDDKRNFVLTPTQLNPTSNKGDVWRSKPVRFEPVYSLLDLSHDDKKFAVDVSHRKLLNDGKPYPLKIQYAEDLKIWGPQGPPDIYVMDLTEICAEKILGWCANGRFKHYADIAFIAAAYHRQISPKQLQQDTMDKLAAMSELFPTQYDGLTTMEDLIARLQPPIDVPPRQWENISYVERSFSQTDLQKMVETWLIPMLRT